MRLKELLSNVPQGMFVQITSSEEEFRAILEEKKSIETITTKAEEIAYVELDSQLAALVTRALCDSLGSKMDGVLFHQNEDWWPNRTRSIELDAKGLNWLLLIKLQSLLISPFDNWLINIQIYEGLEQIGSPYLGVVNVYKSIIHALEIRDSTE
jgi:hypothetical protein